MFKISSQEEFGLRLLVQLAKAGENAEISLAELSSREGISLTYVRKLFGVLRSSGLVKASRGVLGGYSLVKSASEINLKEVFEALKNPEQSFDCTYFSGQLDICANHGNCGVRPLISLLNHKIDEFLENINLSQLIKEEKQVSQELIKTS